MHDAASPSRIDRLRKFRDIGCLKIFLTAVHARFVTSRHDVVPQ